MYPKLFLTSPRNSPAAQRSLFEALKCRTLLTSDSKLPSVLPILDLVKPRCLTIPSLDELLEESFPLFAYNKAFEAGRWDPFFILYVLRDRKDYTLPWFWKLTWLFPTDIRLGRQVFPSRLCGHRKLRCDFMPAPFRKFPLRKMLRQSSISYLASAW